MLKKLYKHEFYSLFRSLLPIYAAVLGFSLLSKLTNTLDTDNQIVGIILGLTTTLYIFAIIAVFIISMVVVVTRFYKNLLSSEGYLTFVLPFTPTQHIICKLICGVAVTVLSSVAVICSLLILGAGTEILSDILNILKLMLADIFNKFSAGQTAVLSLEFLLMLVLSPVQSLLMFYAAIAIGQQFKNRIGGAVISYVGLYAAVQTISTVLMLVFTFIGGTLDSLEAEILAPTGDIDLFGGIVIVLVFLILYQLILCSVYFFITRYFLTKKLNLE